MREIAAELKELRLYGMAGAWVDLTSQSPDAPKPRPVSLSATPARMD